MSLTLIKKLFLTSLALTAAGAAMAVPAMRGLRPVVQADGSVIYVQRVGDEHRNYTLDADGALLRNVDGFYRLADLMADGTLTDAMAPVMWDSEAVQQRIADLYRADEVSVVQQPASMRAASIGMLPGRDFPVFGEQKAIVVLVEYSDVKFTLDDPYAYFNAMLNAEGFSDPQFGGTGSCRDYFIEASLGQFSPQFDVYGPVTLSKNRAYYGANDAKGNDVRAGQMVLEACQMLDKTVDFSEYDRNGDGLIDNVFVFYAGQGEATYGPDESVWPHSSIVTGGYLFDGVTLRTYGCTNEWGNNRPDGIGTFVHEFSHVMGLPDLYNTVKNTTYTPGHWSVLDYGPYCNQGRTPPTYSTFERNALGWIDLIELTPDMDPVSIPDLRTSNVGYCLTNPSNSTEFYLFENRQQSGSDAYLPGHGLLVWHVDYNNIRWSGNTVNNDNNHQCVDLIEADGRPSKTMRSEADPFPGSTRNSRIDKLSWWNGKHSGVALRGITEADSEISMRVVEVTQRETEYYTVDDLLRTSSDVAEAKLRGYIVGYVKSGNLGYKTVDFAAGSIKTNLLLADSPDADDWCDCTAVQLSINTDPRAALNLSEHPELIGCYVELTGNICDYLGARGLRSVTDYTILKMPDSSAITDVANDAIDGADEWFTLQGVKVDAPAAPGVYLHRTSHGTEKVLVK